MKKYISYVLLILTLVCCQRAPINDRLDALSKELDDNSKYAYEELCKMSVKYQNLSSHDRARLQLLTIKAKYLSDITLTDSDALVMRDVVDYYRYVGERYNLVESLYLLGSVYRDMRDAPMALDCFHQALTEAHEGDESELYPLLERIYTHIGSLHRRQKAYDVAWEAYNRAHDIALEYKDTAYALSAEWMKMSVRYLKDDYGYVAKNARRLIHESLAHGDTVFVTSNLIGCVLSYTRLKRYAEAWEILRLYEKLCNSNEYSPFYYTVKGELYLADGKVDTAEICLRKHIDAKDWNGLQARYRVMSVLFESRCELDSAMKYAVLLCAAVDSDYQHKINSHILELQSLYDYTIYCEHQLRSEAEVHSMRQRLWLCIISAILLLALLAMLYFRWKQKYLEGEKIHADKMLEMERRVSQAERQMREGERTVSEASLVLAEKDSMLAHYRQELAELRFAMKGQDISDTIIIEYKNKTEVLEDRIKALTSQIAQDRLELERNRAALDELQTKTAFYHDIDIRLLDSGGAQAIVDRCLNEGRFPSEEEWRMMETVVVRMYPNVISNLKLRVKNLKDTKLKCVILCLMDVAKDKMPDIIGRSRQGIHSAILRLFYDACGRNASDIDEVKAWLKALNG